MLRVLICCSGCRKQTRVWASSRAFAGHHLVNHKYVCSLIIQYLMFGHRLVHAFTAAGCLPSQYTRFSKFAEMGVVGKGYIGKGQCGLHFRSCMHAT